MNAYVEIEKFSDYQEFVSSKLVAHKASGFECDKVHESLFSFQRDAVKWACRLGKAAIFFDTGLGKTRLQVEWARLVFEYTGGNVLILAPLAVAPQTIKEAAKIGVIIRYCRSQDEVQPGITIANYEMLQHFNASNFVGIVLDESSILKNFMGKTKRMIIDAFHDTPYKLACSATPAPNDHLELGNHAEFLNVMRSNEMISRFFINDSMEMCAYRLKGHARQAFWQWCSSWAMSITKPSDMGYSDDGFILPKLDIQIIEVSTEDLPPVEGSLFRDVNLSATNIHNEMRLTAPRRAKAVADLIALEPDETWLIWCNTDYEANELVKLIPNAIEVRGSMPLELKEKILTNFSEGHIKRLITKPKIAGQGMNWQHCARVAFVGLSYSYEALYQAIRRVWRFGQVREVKAWIITADSETGVLETVKRKESEHKMMQSEMAAAISEYHIKPPEILTGIQDTASGENWTLYHGDCVHVMRELPDNCVDLSIFSPPFAQLYIYSDSIHDMGNTRDHEEFFEQYRYVARELYRITRDGRLCAIHCKDLPLFKNRDGNAGLYDFPSDLRKVHEDEGWVYHSRVTIWKDPVIEMQRTKNHGLLYKQLCKDSAASRQGMADYLIILRKWGDESKWDPVTRHGERFFDYIGSTMSAPGKREISKGRTKKEQDRLYSIAVWQRYASPVWFDIHQTDVLNIQQARECEDEKHICPLQLGIVERAIELWSNPNDMVFSPFAGIGTELYQAIRMGRRAMGAELKRSYFDSAIRHLRSARAAQIDLLSLIDAHD